MSTITIPKGEQGAIRVFAISRPMPDMSRALKNQTKEALAAELLGVEVDAGAIELFALSDLTGVGLPRYLAEGYDVSDTQLASDRARLEALDGYVLLLFSRAFDGAQATLQPSPDLTLIGTYHEAAAAMQGAPIESAAAKPYSGTPAETPAIAPQGRPGSAMIVLGIVIVLVLLLLWIML